MSFVSTNYRGPRSCFVLFLFVSCEILLLVILGLCCQERCLPGVTLIATFVNEHRHPCPSPAQQPCSTCRRDFSRSQSICPVPSAFSFFLPLFVIVFVFLLVVLFSIHIYFGLS
jgi:hypothetical protein